MLLLVHEPPETPSVSVVTEATQTEVAPEMVPAEAPDVTVNVVIARADPQLVVIM